MKYKEINKRLSFSLRAVLVGGNANNGVNAGLGYVNANNVPANTNVNIGSQIYLIKNIVIRKRDLASWRKIKYKTVAIR